jgi:hypothetical protein
MIIIIIIVIIFINIVMEIYCGGKTMCEAEGRKNATVLGWIERGVTTMAARVKREAVMNSNGRKKMK